MVPIKFIDHQKDGIGPGSGGGEHGASLPLHYQLDQEARSGSKRKHQESTSNFNASPQASDAEDESLVADAAVDAAGAVGAGNDYTDADGGGVGTADADGGVDAEITDASAADGVDTVGAGAADPDAVDAADATEADVTEDDDAADADVAYY